MPSQSRAPQPKQPATVVSYATTKGSGALIKKRAVPSPRALGEGTAVHHPGPSLVFNSCVANYNLKRSPLPATHTTPPPHSVGNNRKRDRQALSFDPLSRSHNKPPVRIRDSRRAMLHNLTIESLPTQRLQRHCRSDGQDRRHQRDGHSRWPDIPHALS
ncbi:hypothetical protein BO82DRAFT_116215 [Aspergillus uvarum CBS 121591]|uniref:Uncharacterized protein n=1 Tax=Aspergillus uvarum CBS 121591 TaxID=1448315 RepID=A0A319DDH1_9EURO|nr:hypothetical protein BO82DRAFT_116215 [Aspergillus uvarum CBS 121591]PYH86128.1 hypothetical protein BO82DRAFT_116215 [Aspergillus uvarum CBS 121591]